MLKKVYFVIICLLLAASMSCESKPKIDPKPIEAQVQKEASEFEKVIGEIVTATDSIKYLADVSLSALIPKEWLCEINQPSGQQLSATIGVPIPNNLIRGMKVTKSDQGWVYYTGGDKMDPDTDRYVVSVYSGKSNLFFSSSNIKDFNDYPKLLSLDCFPGEQIVQSPYYIPPEATHGLYSISGPDFRKNRSNYNISQLLSDLAAANPYAGKSSVADSEAAKLPDVVKRFKEQIAVINKDMDVANSFATALEEKYGKKSGTWTTREAVDSFKKMLTENKAKAMQIDASLNKISTWDFSRLEQYRSLKTK